jgi:hypothetical protein
MTNWNDFNDAQPQAGFDLLPRGTLVLVRMSIKPGGFDDAEQGWTGGWATASADTGSVYLSAEFVVLDGPHAKRKLWSNIGLHSPKGDEWANMGRAFIRAALNSARGVSAKDTSEAAQAARHITHFGELDGLWCLWAGSMWRKTLEVTIKTSSSRRLSPTTKSMRG